MTVSPYLQIRVDDEDDDNGWVQALVEAYGEHLRGSNDGALPARQMVVYDDLWDELVDFFMHGAPPPPAPMFDSHALRTQMRVSHQFNPGMQRNQHPGRRVIPIVRVPRRDWADEPVAEQQRVALLSDVGGKRVRNLRSVPAEEGNRGDGDLPNSRGSITDGTKRARKE